MIGGADLRLDKLLANAGYGSRKDVKVLLKKKQVTINDAIVSDGSIHINRTSDKVRVQGNVINYQEFVYLMMNKPKGVISATKDNKHKTVIDLLDNSLMKRDIPFPVGRLDKDTEGLLLLTNDGKLAHQLLSPKKDVEKTYYAKIQGVVLEKDVVAFQKGVTLDDGYITKPAKLVIIKSDVVSEVEVTLTEGKFHQVKRMFAAVNKKVVYLKRIRMGGLILDESLKLGAYRELSEQEILACFSNSKEE